MILINTITIIKIIILVKHLGAFYILGSLDDRLNYLYSYKLLFLTPKLHTVNISNKRKAPNADNVYSRLGKNYDKVDDEIVFFFFWRINE